MFIRLATGFHLEQQKYFTDDSLEASVQSQKSRLGKYEISANQSALYIIVVLYGTICLRNRLELT